MEAFPLAHPPWYTCRLARWPGSLACGCVGGSFLTFIFAERNGIIYKGIKIAQATTLDLQIMRKGQKGVRCIFWVGFRVVVSQRRLSKIDLARFTNQSKICEIHRVRQCAVGIAAQTPMGISLCLYQISVISTNRTVSICTMKKFISAQSWRATFSVFHFFW